MRRSTQTADAVFRLSPRIELLPILHASGDMAQEVRETLISRRFDCLAVPLPPSVEPAVEAAVEALPRINLILLPEPDQNGLPAASFIPVDPCQAVMMGIRVASGEGVVRAYIDREVRVYEPALMPAPDPYALKQVSAAAFAASLMLGLPAPATDSQQAHRIHWMAFKLHELEIEFESILCVCHVADWPWLREAYQERRPYCEPDSPAGRPCTYGVSPNTLYFVLGELPFLTEQYERRRAALRSDEHLSVDGIKELLLETRTRWLNKHESPTRSVANWVTPHLLQRYLQYVRNLALLQHRLTPDLYSLVLAAKQMAGDEFAIELIETARTYAFQLDDAAAGIHLAVSAGIGKLHLPDGEVVRAKNRLEGSPVAWRPLTLTPKPPPLKRQRWIQQWNPFRQCSWPPEDQRIESFTRHVREQAKAILGADLARVEKFTTSVKDGIDLRESLRHWHRFPPRTGSPERRTAGPVKPEIYVKDMPPARGNVEAVVFLFDTPADPARYAWRATWQAEHQEESTLCFYADPFHEQMVGPGIAQSQYGGALFLFPPRPIADIWIDSALDFAETMEERLIATAAIHSREPHIVLVTPTAPRSAWRRIARQAGRRLVSIPLNRFSGQTIDRLRRFHVLNGHEIRSYAANFIRS